ncbi:MAG: hypothetical protein ONB44_02765 [candidate division KSB1 bacterium]|nr:hypothetical protein [candidate division KSB1 bacterium]MDZ7301047.1 hypothetical protein [candidate division KSB1 bacterium]MDZ7312128.1 hypothetical protein [candidate division KSB1 bacterium]
MRFLKTLFLMFMLLPSLALAQNQYVPSKERSDFSERRKTYTSANLVGTTIFNYGITGRSAARPDEVCYEWPAHSGKIYMALTSPMYGAEVRKPDNSFQRIMTAALGKPDLQGGSSWELQPITGYINTALGSKAAVANLLDKSSWPPVWPDKFEDKLDPGWKGSWNGLFGKVPPDLSVKTADQEFFFKTGDDHFDKWIGVFRPDLTDSSRYGLGIIMETRVLQWSQVLVQDVVFILHYFKNDGSKLLERFGVNILLADLVGGDGSDDIAYFSLATDVAWSTDADGIGDRFFGTDPVGVVATSFLETPGNFTDGIDNDLDGEANSPIITPEIISGEQPDNLIDDNGNGLIDEGEIHLPRTTPVFNPGNGYADGIDNDNDGEPGSPVVTAEMLVGEIANNGKDDNGNGLRDEGPEDVGKKYADKKDSNGNGLVDEGIDEMIDESREDGIDNDGDWNPITDDVGLDGLAGSGDFGENDGKPTSGAGTNFPGEPSVDKTDISESDQIGFTNVQYEGSGQLNSSLADDRAAYRKFIVPGIGNVGGATGDYNLFVGAGLFPMQPGITERISLAVCMGQDTTDALLNRKAAQTTYDTDYQFALTPLVPTLTAVAGDGEVHLYWDELAERSFDRFLSRLGENPYDFEGYRIYRSTDDAWEDVSVITDGAGNVTLRKPLIQFDLVDGISGYHPVDFNGVKFYLGNETGLVHHYVDKNVVNGQRYFYAITAYDRGLVDRNEPNKGIAPGESPISIQRDEAGNYTLGRNVAIVTPNPPSAGYNGPTTKVEHVAGSSSGLITVNLFDRTAIRDGQRYRVTFEDTTIVIVGREDTLKTKNYSLIRLPDVVLLSRSKLNSDLVADGFFLQFANEPQVAPDLTRTKWRPNGDKIHRPDFRIPTVGFSKGKKVAYDYEVIVGNTALDTSSVIDFGGLRFTEMPVNFKVHNITLNKPIEFAFIDSDPTGSTPNLALFSRTKNRQDAIFFIENVGGTRTVTWFAGFATTFVDTLRNPQGGDTLRCVTSKPFLSSDVYEFTMVGEKTDNAKAAQELSRIRVVPNPYVAAASWEPRNLYSSGRGPRSIHFNHLPQKCTIRIFNVAGELVDTIEHESTAGNGTAEWDLLSRDNLSISYGIYIFHVDAPGIGEYIGKFAVIK